MTIEKSGYRIEKEGRDCPKGMWAVYRTGDMSIVDVYRTRRDAIASRDTLIAERDRLQLAL